MARTRNEALHVKRKAQITRAARKCFIAKGIHSSSMQDICKTSKISPGALYRYYPSKQAIIEAIAAEEHQQNTDLVEYIRAQPSALEALCEAVPDILDQLLQKDFARLMIEISTEATRNEAVRSAFSTVEDQFKSDLTQIFKDAKAEGSIRSEIDIESSIFLFLTLLDGITSRAAGGQTPPRKAIAKSLINAIKALFPSN